MALGAQPRQVLGMVVGQGLWLAAGGLAAGAVLAFVFSHSVLSLSFTSSAMGTNVKLMGSSAADPLIYLAAAAFLCIVAGLASYLPARRAASVDPMQALRTE
jgi:ABC-type antimicrobial peptide transport system permease subunit